MGADMDVKASAQETLSSLSGRTVKAAFSSLTNFSCELDNGHGLIVEAVESASGPAVSLSLVNAAELPKESDAVCRVDWGWIVGSTVAAASANASALRLQLAPAGPLTISVNVWQGKPFLSFQPFRPAK